jgi:KDO2-lipid IV(A) lauroyltransferase
VWYFTLLLEKTPQSAKFESLMLIIVFRLLSWLPLSVLHAAGVALGWLVYLLSPSYRRTLKENIGRAGFADHLRAAIGETGKSITELPFVWYADPAYVAKAVKMENWEVVQRAFDAGNGVLFLTPHLGCFEATAQAMAEHTPLTVLYRPPRKAILKPLLEDARARHNLALAPANLAGVRMLFKALKKNGVIGLLPDQVPQLGEGVWANFFGTPAYTMTLPAKLHQMTGAPIILTYAERLPHGKGYVMHFVPFEGILSGSAEQQAEMINAAMEKLIARCPAQYFWSYKRYKVPPGVEAPSVLQETGT